MCDRSVQRDRAMVTNRENDVGLEPFAVADISDQDSLVFLKFNQLGKIGRKPFF